MSKGGYRVSFVLAQTATESGPELVAVVGAVTGTLALLLSLGIALRERARLHVEFSTFIEEDGEGEEWIVPLITVANVGRLPAFLTEVHTTPSLPRLWRWPVTRSLSFRTQRRRFVRWLGAGQETILSKVPADGLPGRIDPGEMRAWELSSAFPTAHQLIARRSWAVVTSGLRRHVARIEVPQALEQNVDDALRLLGVHDDQRADFPIRDLSGIPGARPGDA